MCSDSVKHLKMKLVPVLGVPIPLLRLMLDGRELKDDGNATLQSCGVYNGATLLVLLRSVRPGSAAATALAQIREARRRQEQDDAQIAMRMAQVRHMIQF